MIAGKKKLCYVEVSDFTNIQGVGNDPMYKRYNSVYAIVKQHIDEPYHSFLAEPEYSAEDDRVYWYTEEWGYDLAPIKITDLDPEARQMAERKLTNIVNHYKQAIASLSGETKRILESAIKFVNVDFVYCIGDRLVLAVWGMEPDIHRHNATGVIMHELDLTEYHTIVFDPGKHGALINKFDAKVKRRKGGKLTSKDLPKIKAQEGFELEGWDPDPIGVLVNEDLTFVARYREIEKPKCNVCFVAGENCTITGTDTLQVERGTILSEDQIPQVTAREGFEFTGWDRDPHEAIDEDTTFHAVCRESTSHTCHIRFISDGNCELMGPLDFDIPQGGFISSEQIPDIQCNPGYRFAGWSADITAAVTGDMQIYAKCEALEEDNIHVNFDAGDYGTMEGTSSYLLPRGSKLLNSQVPQVKPYSGYKFVGWDINPLESALDNDITFQAVYKERRPWWKGLWPLSWGCLWKFLLFLLLLLLFLYLLSLLRGCDGSVLSPGDVENGPALVDIGDSTSDQFRDNPGFADDGQIGDVPSTPIDEPDLGEDVDPGNGDSEYHVGILPADPSIPPIDNPDNPQGPQIIPNIINVFFTDDNANLNAFAKDFRSIYPDTQKYKLDYDDLVKRVSIMMPVEEREAMKREIERRLGEKYSFFIVDEYVIQQNAAVVKRTSEADAGWHLLAVNAPKAWTITIGNPEITVAVVDDGFDTTHDALKDKIVSPYNVYTKSRELTNGSGHGTHTAGLAVGLVREDGKAGGLAPGCKLMPVQVFDGETSSLSAEISGIAYAIHYGADVVNISMGGSYAGYRDVPAEEQLEIAKQKGKVEELLWKRVFRMAQERKTILVFSAGNDNVVSYLNPQNRHDSLIIVTAVDKSLNKSIFNNEGAGSNYGLGSKVAAPGSEIYSTVPVNDYAMMQGTSMAAPIVTGVVALLKSINPDITGGEAINILKRSGRRLSDSSLGPLVQADRALALLQSGSLPGGGDSDGENDWDSDPSDEDKEHSGGGGTAKDYSDIFRQIAEHQRAIVDLIKKLPPEEQEKYK